MSTLNPTFDTASSRHISFLWRIILLRAHPLKFVFDLIGSMWAVYFLFLGNWQLALTFAFVPSILALTFIWDSDERRIARATGLGKLMVIHTHPQNIALHVLALWPLIQGIWQHNTHILLIGLTIAALGHLKGWGRRWEETVLGPRP